MRVAPLLFTSSVEDQRRPWLHNKQGKAPATGMQTPPLDIKQDINCEVAGWCTFCTNRLLLMPASKVDGDTYNINEWPIMTSLILLADVDQRSCACLVMM
jgi:hypothetical protein